MVNRLLFMFLGIVVMWIGMAYAGEQASPSSTQISSKQTDGKAAAMLDVSQTPPSTAPEVPIPYPNTGIASDTTKGSKQVKISDKDVQLKNKSNYKKSSGDEPGTQSPPNIRRRSDTATSTEKVKIKGREVELKNKDTLNDKYDQNPYP